jgi:hypothetical protein
VYFVNLKVVELSLYVFVPRFKSRYRYSGPSRETTDYNKFQSGNFTALDDYAQAYDNWYDAQEQDYHRASGEAKFAGRRKSAKKVWYSRLPGSQGPQTVRQAVYTKKIHPCPTEQTQEVYGKSNWR